MAQLVYIDETGSVGTAAGGQPFLTLVAVLVEENKVRPLDEAMKAVVWQHLGWFPAEFEYHGHELWGGTGWWSKTEPAALIEAYESVISVLGKLDLQVAHASIDKHKLSARYGGLADKNAYRLALQFLLEKIDRLDPVNRILVADEAKEEQLRAIKMVADMQQWGGGEVPGRTLSSVIDSLHFVRSVASTGVQIADLVAFVIQRFRRGTEKHPDAASAIRRLNTAVSAQTVTWRQPWPS